MSRDQLDAFVSRLDSPPRTNPVPLLTRDLV